MESNRSHPSKYTVFPIFIKDYLIGDNGHNIPFQSVFLTFRDVLFIMPGGLQACSPSPPLRSMATSTADIPFEEEARLPRSVSVVSRTVDVSESRRKGTVHILWKLMSIALCRNESEIEKLWKARGPTEAGERFLGVAVWAERTEKEIFQKSQQNLSEYKNLLLNLVMGLVGKTNWLNRGLPENHLTNSSAQTQESFQQSQRSAEDILKQPEELTKQEFSVLKKQNRVSERKARRRRRLELRHSYTQTGASLRDGLKSAESESSGAFDWLDLAPSPVRFFPMLWVATQTDDKDIMSTDKVVVNAKLGLQLGREHPLKSVLDFVIRHWDTKVGVASQFPNGIAPSAETALGLRVAHFVQLLLKTPNLVFGRCPTHRRGAGLQANCPSCEAAIKTPPPWADSMLKMLCEFSARLRLHVKSMQIVTMHYLDYHGIEKEDKRIGLDGGSLEPCSLLVLHLLRRLVMDYKVNWTDTGYKLDPELRAEVMDCGCFVSRMFGVLQSPDEPNARDVLEKLYVISNKIPAAQFHPAHACFRCGAQESVSPGKFLVCSWCRRQRLLAKAHYCSTDCLLKDWHKHHKLHDALAPGRIANVGSAVMLFKSEKSNRKLAP